VASSRQSATAQTQRRGGPAARKPSPR
jgi:hypothetical protein